MKAICFALLMTLIGAQAISGQTFTLTSNSEFEQIIPEDLPTGIEFKGLFKKGLSFNDKAGKNFFFVTEVWNARHNRNRLYFYLVTFKQKIAKINWEVTDVGDKDCPVQLVDHSFRAIDLDGDGYLETSFMYTRACSGAEKTDLRLVFNTRGDRLVMWGTLPKKKKEIEVNTTDNYRSAPPIYRWFMKKDWNDYVKFRSVEYDRYWYFFLPECRILHNRNIHTPTGNYYDWVDEKGKAIYLPNELSDVVNTAKDFKLMPSGEDLLVLHAEALGILNLRSRNFTPWIDFYDYTFILSSWTWTSDGSRFAFPTFNSIQYPEKTQVFVVDVDSTGMVAKREYDLALDYTLGDVLSAPGLRWDGHDLLWYVPRRGKNQQFEPAPKGLLIE